jgi:hypothetical protein
MAEKVKAIRAASRHAARVVNAASQMAQLVDLFHNLQAQA